MLTRAQVEAMVPLTNMNAQTVNLGAGEGFVGIYTALLLMIDHDAALRAEVSESTQRRSETVAMCEQLTAELEGLKQDVVPRSRYDTCNRDWLEALEKVKAVQEAATKEIAAQLAARTQELNKYMEERDRVIAWRKADEEMIKGQTQQLTASEARVKELEQQYAIISEDANRFHWLTTDHESREARVACRALLDRMGVMSSSAACTDIDQLRMAYPTPELEAAPKPLNTGACVAEWAKDCAEHSQDHARAQLGWNAAKKRLAQMEEALRNIKGIASQNTGMPYHRLLSIIEKVDKALTPPPAPAAEEAE